MAGRLTMFGITLASLSCSSAGNTVCPMHIDGQGPAAMQIETADGSNSIAAVEVVEGPCREWGPGRGLFDAAPGAHAVVIERIAFWASTGTSDPCIIRVVSLDGRCATITATVEWHEYPTKRHCVDNADCCLRSQVVPFTLQRWEFAEPVIWVSFGDAAVCTGRDAGGTDGGAVDCAID